MLTSKKRTRDDDDGDYEELTRATKQCKLPFRSSPTSRQSRGFSLCQRNRPTPLLTQTITPADSSEEETSPPFSSSCQSRNLRPLTALNTSSAPHTIEQSVDVDMEVIDSPSHGSPRYLGQDSAMPSPKPSPCTSVSTLPTFRDPFKDYQNSASGGRLPTPIYGHFQHSIDAKMDMGEDPETLVSRTQQEIEYAKYVRRRRLPTPIDEDEVMDSSITLDRLAMEPEPWNEHASSKFSWLQPASAFAPPARATRLSFSMGIRADCDMCRMKVPGHSNHIFRT